MILKQSEHDYFGRPLNIISPSDLKKGKTPAEFYYFKFVENEEQKEARETKATKLGTLAHMLIEKQKIEDKFWIFTKPYPDRNMNFGLNKEALAKQEIENAGKKMVEEKDYNNLSEMTKNLTNIISENLIYHPDAIIEHSFYAKIIFDRDGVFQKVEDLADFAEIEADKKNPDYIIMHICTKPDFLLPDIGLDMDFKTCKSAFPAKFAKDAYDMGYTVQAAMGLDITSAVLKTDIDTFLFLALEKEAPYLGSLLNAEEDFIEYGRAVYRKRLLKVYHYAKQGFFPGYSIYSSSESDGSECNKPIPLHIPHYAIPVEEMKF